MATISTSSDYRLNTLNTVTSTIGSNYHYSTSSYTSTYTTSFTTSTTNTSGTTTQSSSNIIGIHTQPYRNYLTERNHFYHSASQPTTFTTSTSSTLRPSSIISSIQGNQTTSPGQTSLNHQNQQSDVQKNQKSLFSSIGVQKYNNTGSKQSLNSQSSNNHNNKMAANNQQLSNSLIALDTGYAAKSSSMNNIDDDDDDDYDLYQPTACSKCIYNLGWLMAQIGLFGSVILLVYWFFKFDRGFAYQYDKRKMYNLHAFLMMTGFIFVNGQSMLIYKTYLCCKKIYNKITHAFFFVISIGLVAFGFLIGFQAQSIATSLEEPIQHFYSLHSWIGITVCTLFALQFLFGFIAFLVLLCCDRSTARCRARFLPTHVTFGIIIFMLAIAACLSGILQTARHRLTGPSLNEINRADYRNMRVFNFNIFENSGLVINMVGACLIFLACLIPYLVLNFRNRPSTFNLIRS